MVRKYLLRVRMPGWMVDRMDYLVERGYYPSRSELIRTAVRELLKREGVWE